MSSHRGEGAPSLKGHDFSLISIHAPASAKTADQPDGREREPDRDSEQTALPPMVRKTLRSQGQPLGSEIRALMEPRFGHDFSRVRLHSDATAHASTAAEGALAYTAGRDVVFGSGQYRPDTVAGRWLIAHELAHVVQQEKSDGRKETESGALEQEAGEAGMRVALGGISRVSAAQRAPGLQFLKVSSGGFGKALEDYTNTHSVDNKEVLLLQKSPTFRGLAATLDKHYVWFEDPVFATHAKFGPTSRLKLGPDGRATDPASVKGMRAMKVTMGGGARFATINTAPDFFPSDTISVESTEPPFIQEIAHEATHAAAFVSGGAPAAKTLVAEIEAGIQDEIHARKSEAQVIREIPDRTVRQNSQPVGSRDAWQVERDLSEGLGSTYLESFFFSRELRDAQAAQKLDDSQASKIRNEIDNLFGSKGVLKPSPGFGQIWFNWKTAIQDWIDFNKTHSPGDANFDVEKEKLIQDHAKRFFKGNVSYRPIPKAKP